MTHTALAPVAAFRRALWVGTQQWVGLPGSFGFGQEGWAQRLDERGEYYLFYPGIKGVRGYQVRCSGNDLLLFTSPQDA